MPGGTNILIVGVAPYPPLWDVFDHNVKGYGPSALGFHSRAEAVNRFAARYRMARAFQGATFLGVAGATASAYSALTGLLFSYSAFEHFLKALPLELRNSATLLQAGEAARSLAPLQNLNIGTSVAAFMRPHVERRFQRHLDQYLAGSPCNPFMLAACARHTFVHGYLTANSVAASPFTVSTFANVLQQQLFATMDREFEERMRAFLQAHPPAAGT